MALSAERDGTPARLPAPRLMERDLPGGVGPDGVDRRSHEPPGLLQRWWRSSFRERRLGALLDRSLDGVAHVLHDRRVGSSPRPADHVVVAPSGIWVLGAVHESTSMDSPELFGAIGDVDLVADAVAAIGYDWVTIRPTLTVSTSALRRRLRHDGVPVVGRRRLVRSLLGPGALRPADLRTIASVLNERLPRAESAR